MSKKIKNSITELVFIIDRSGSMCGLEQDTAGGFNSLINKQKHKDGKCYVSAVLFDNVCEVLYDRNDISEIREMTVRDCEARGSTALMDALGGAIHHIGNIHKYARAEDVPEHTMFVIITDGLENSSVRYSANQVRAMVEKEKSQYGWEFIFLGANIDAVETAARYGIDADRAVNYNSDSEGTQMVYDSISAAVDEVRMCMPLGAEWRESIDRDYEERGRKDKNKRK